MDFNPSRKKMEQQFRDKMSNHEFPLQPSDWEKMQQRLDEGKAEQPKPIARFFNFKFIVLAMTIITLLIAALWHWVQPEKVQTPEKEPVTVANKEAFASSEGFLNTSQNEKQNSSVAYTNQSQNTTILPFRGRGLDTTKPKELAILKGKVIEAKTEEDAIGAYVKLFQNGKQIAIAATDFEGIFGLSKISVGKYDILVTYENFKDKLIKDFQLKIGFNKIDIQLERDTTKTKPIATEYKVPLIQEDGVGPPRKEGMIFNIDGYPYQSGRTSAYRDELLVLNPLDTIKNKAWRAKFGLPPSPSGRVGMGSEKAYLHLDRTLFKPNEDLWFSMYLRDANTLLPSQQSQILYVDLIAPNGNVQESKTYLVFDGQAAGDFHLGASLKGGIYKLRAYTNWMKNTNDIFEREITLQAVVLPNLSMKLEFERKAYGASDEVVAKFDANTLENKALANTELNFTASLAGSILTTGTAQTNEKGRAYIKFNLPKDLTTNDGIVNITLQHNGQTEAISRAIPIVLNKLDFQLLPEGGEILAASLNRIAFKALNEFGKPADVEGIVKNPKGETVTTFKSFHQGMGAFELIAKEIGTYQVHITKPENITQVFNFQVDTLKKAVLMVDNLKDQLRVKIAANDSRFDECYVVAQMNDKIVFEAAINIENNTMQLLDIPTKDWGMGIARITLFDKNGTPCNERLVFLNRDKVLNISIKTDKAQYQPREKVSLKIKVSDDKGLPVKGNFSLAVADDAQLTFADDKQGHILSALLLESELKGKIEEPNFYFDTKEEKSLQALDYLLLTQGWRRLEWKEVLKAEEIVKGYQLPNEKASIKGIVIDEKSKNRIGNLTIALDPDGVSTKTNSNGEFEFKNIKFNSSKILKILSSNIAIDNYDNNIELSLNNNWVYAEKYRDIYHGSLFGKVVEAKTGEDAIGAYVKLLKNNKQILLTSTDFEGNYYINIEPGVYDIEVSYVGMNTHTIPNLVINAGRKTKVDVKLGVSSNILQEVVVTQYKVPLVQQDNTTSGGTVTSEQIKNMPTRNVTAIVGLTNGVQTNQSGDINIKGARKEGTVYMVDGVRVQGGGALPPAQEIGQLQLLGGIEARLEDFEGSTNGNDLRIFNNAKNKKSNNNQPVLSGVPVDMTAEAEAVPNIKIRGNSSINPNANPLYVIDGISYTSQDNLVKNLDPNNIAKIDVLKDVAATNLYGDRGKNGVILITLKNKISTNYATTRTFYTPIYDHKEKPEVRNDFRSTIFWKPDLATDDKGEATIEFYNSDALTTFRATLEGIGAKGNIGRAEYRYATNLPLNLSAKMPDKVLTGDVIKIPLSLKNNSENAQKININVTKPSHFEAVGDIPSEVTLKANEAKTLFLSYKVTTQSSSILGESQTFLIETTSDDWSDKFEAKVKTLPRGFPVTQIFSADKLQNTFNLSLRQPVEKTAKLTLTAYPNALDDILQGMERMLRQPSGCFEQVSSSNYPNLLVLDLLRNTQNTRPDVEQRAMDFLKDGYKRLTAYECKSGGFDWWGRDPAHEGLTAYGILEFTDMARVFDVDKNLIDRSVKWLLNRKNNKGGWTLNPAALHGWQNDAVLDAYIVYALASSGYGKEISKEIEAVANSDAAKKDAYTQVLLANTYLSLGDKNNAKSLIDNLLKTQAQDGSFVGNTHSVFHAYGNAFKVETTALVALALMQTEGYDSFLAKAMSFIVQSKSEYGYGNTQSTVMALKALCNYARLQKNGDNGGNIIVLVNDKKVAEKSYSKSQFGKVQIADLEQFISTEQTNIKVVFEQTNKAIPFDLNLQYASKMPNNAAESPLQFSTTLAQNQAKIGDVVRQTASMKNISKNIVASPIMIVGIPAGMTAQPWQLKQIVERKECAFYEIFNNYIVFYFDEIKPNELINIYLDLRADIGGSYEAPASAAYPYYTNEWRVWSKPEAILVN